MKGMTRRSFMGAAAAMGALSAMNIAVADEAAPAESVEFVPGGGSFAEGALDLGWTGTPVEIAALGGSTMPLEELNRRRRAYIDSLSEYTCADGTVIALPYVKARAVVNVHGLGAGNVPHDYAWGRILQIFDEELAEFYASLPFGVAFNAAAASASTGLPVDECVEKLERISDGGFLCRFDTNDGTRYHHLPFVQGVTEYAMKDRVADPGYFTGVTGADFGNILSISGTPLLQAIPCSTDIVAGEGVLPYDDVEEIIKSKTRFALAPCTCRYVGAVQAGAEGLPTFDDFATGEYDEFLSPVNGYRIETCLHMGDEADCWIKLGLAREITQEEALHYMERSREDGFVLQSVFTENIETICSCSLQGNCNVLGAMWAGCGEPADWPKATAFGQVSRYCLEVNLETCAKCGTCASRCPLMAITMGEDGYPQVAPNCFRCGQCAYVCPTQSRWLERRPAEQNLPRPERLIDDMNLKAAYRFEHGLVG